MPIPPRQTLAALAAAVAVLAWASVAQAIPPTIERHHDEGIFTLPDFDCGSYTLHEEMLSEDATIITYYDQGGDVERVQQRFTFLGEITNSATGETFRDHVALNFLFDGGTTTERGNAFSIVRQGEGAILQLMGRRIVDADGNLVFQAGPDDILGGFESSVCAALA